MIRSRVTPILHVFAEVSSTMSPTHSRAGEFQLPAKLPHYLPQSPPHTLALAPAVQAEESIETKRSGSDSSDMIEVGLASFAGAQASSATR
jgi:hypothetical protein